jgi:hypothetical protein
VCWTTGWGLENQSNQEWDHSGLMGSSLCVTREASANKLVRPIKKKRKRQIVSAHVLTTPHHLTKATLGGKRERMLGKGGPVGSISPKWTFLWLPWNAPPAWWARSLESVSSVWRGVCMLETEIPSLCFGAGFPSFYSQCCCQSDSSNMQICSCHLPVRNFSMVPLVSVNCNQETCLIRTTECF